MQFCTSILYVNVDGTWWNFNVGNETLPVQSTLSYSFWPDIGSQTPVIEILKQELAAKYSKLQSEGFEVVQKIVFSSNFILLA